MSDTRFDDLIHQLGTATDTLKLPVPTAFQGLNWGIYEGRLAAGIMGIAFGGTQAVSDIDMYDIAADGFYKVSCTCGYGEEIRGLSMVQIMHSSLLQTKVVWKISATAK